MKTHLCHSIELEKLKMRFLFRPTKKNYVEKDFKFQQFYDIDEIVYSS